MKNPNTKYETGVWYGWNGGECPVHSETRGELTYADGTVYFSALFGDYNWDEPLMFRIVTPYVLIADTTEPAPKLECWVYTDHDGKIMGETRIDLEQTAEVMARHYGGRVVRMVEADE